MLTYIISNMLPTSIKVMYQSPKLKNAGRYRGGKPVFLARRSAVDQLTVNQPVGGSIPPVPAILVTPQLAESSYQCRGFSVSVALIEV